jgi:hypothetical protein
MSKYFYTSTDLIKSIKSRCLVPTSQSTFTEQDFLDFATEEMNMAVVPLVLEANQDYYLVTENVPIVQGVLAYDIPYRAIGNKIRDVSLSDANGNNLKELVRLNVGDLYAYNGSYGDGTVGSNAFYVANNQIVFVGPQTNYGQFLRISYYLRPNSLVPNEEVGVIESIDYNTGIITLSNYPEAFALTASLNKPLDFIQQKSPHKILSYDVAGFTVTDSNLKTITLNPADIPTNLVEGDRVAFAMQTDIPQIPSDMHVLLAHRVATRILEAIGDSEGLQNANQKLAELQKNANSLIHNRVEDAPRKVTNFRGTLRSGLVRNRIRRW